MTNNIKKLLLKVLCATLIVCSFIGLLSFIPTYASDSTIIAMTGMAEANVKSEEQSGLRFAANIDATDFTALINEYGKENVEAGMMIVPTDFLKDALSKDYSFTIAGMDAYGAFNGYNYYGTSKDFVEVEDGETVTDYKFYMTVNGITETNYNRDYSARAFIRIKTSELATIDGVDNGEFSKEGEYWYSYAEYNTETHEAARNVYEVAFNAYTDNELGESESIAKKFIDGVAVINGANGVVSIANNTSGKAKDYVASYSIQKNYIDGDYYLFHNAIIYNGERVTAKSINDTENGVDLYVGKSNRAMINADGSVTLEGRQLTGGTTWDVGVRALNNSYISFEGDYGVGTYIDFTYTGNNMPLVMLFANNINGDMSCGNDSKEDFENNGAVNNGYIIMNGAYTKTSWNATDGNIYSIRHGDRVMCIGPNRNSPTLSLASYNSGTSWPVSEATISDDINEIEQSYLATDNSGDQYKYTVGSFVKDGFVYIDLKVKNLTTGVNLGEKSWSTGKTETEIEMLGSNIVVYGCIKENYQENTTFSFSSPYQSTKDDVETYEARFNKDGSVSLDNNYPVSGYGISSVNAIKNSYIAFEGDYGVGTYVEFTFTGNNLPQVCLFANNISGDMSQGDNSTKVNTGYLIMNGMYYTSTDVPNGDIRHPNYLVYFGPNRHASDWNYGALDWRLGITSDTNFHQETLKNNPNQLKYTVGSYLDADLTVIIEVSLYDLTNDTLLKTATIDTGKTQTEVEALGGNIIAYGCCKGGTEPTTFKYDKPYKTMKKGVVSSGAKFNDDGSVSLDSRYSTNGFAWDTGVNSTLNNSYIAFEGNYGVGTYVDFTFTGNNLPQVCLFANNINGNMSQGKESTLNTGYLLMNGLFYTNTTTPNGALRFGDYLMCFGPNRQGTGNVNYNIGEWSDVRKGLTITSDTNIKQSTLATNSNELKYTVATKLDTTDSTVLIEVLLYDITNNTKLIETTYDTDKTQTEVEALGGNIIAYGCCKGGTTPTTFKYTAPYTK